MTPQEGTSLLCAPEHSSVLADQPPEPSGPPALLLRDDAGTTTRPEAVADRSVPTWANRYINALRWTDSAVIALALAVAFVIRFPRGASAVSLGGDVRAPYLWLVFALGAAWCGALALRRTRHRRLIGTGSAEYAAVFSASWLAFAMVAVVCFMLQLELARGFLAIAFPLGTILLLAGRHLARTALYRRRTRGLCMDKVLVVGAPSRAAEIVENLSALPAAGLSVAGVCVPGHGNDTVAGAPVLGSFDNVVVTALTHDVDLVVVTGSGEMTTQLVKRLGWDLEGTGVELALAPALYDIAGPRIVRRPINGTNLLHVDEPKFTGPKYVLKSSVDWFMAALLLAALAPLFLAVAVLVKATSPGPVFFRQERIGRNGAPFRMWKFRSMYRDAEARLAELQALNEGNGVLFKMKDDPRVTSVGRVLRRFSVDELPQLLNVLAGEMSLVGPRPPLAHEVQGYEEHVNRRLLVRPGLTGLWQVSGRSDLSWEDSVRVDLDYVENWSLLGDLLILVRTAGAVLSPNGAY